MAGRVIATSQDERRRVVQTLPVQGKREYWVEMFVQDKGEWQRVRGPFWQRPAALRRIAE